MLVRDFLEYAPRSTKFVFYDATKPLTSCDILVFGFDLDNKWFRALSADEIMNDYDEYLDYRVRYNCTDFRHNVVEVWVLPVETEE